MARTISLGETPPHFADAASVQKRTDGAVVKELVNSRLKPRRLLLQIRDWSSVHLTLPSWCC